MATRKAKKDDAAGCLAFMWLIGIVLLIPSLVVAIFYFSVLKGRYLQSPSVQRVVDTPKMFSSIGTGGIAVFGLLILGGLLAYVVALAVGAVVGVGQLYNKLLTIILFTITPIPALLVFVIYIFRIPILHLGIIGDKENGKLFFPFDMQSYTFGDYVKMRFVKDACSIDSINFSEINKITRGYGRDLYIHGAFGSRKITMSSKQKRDECIAMIQNICGKKGVLASEIESY